MKLRNLFLFVLLGFGIFLPAKADENNSEYLFPAFTKGKIRMKTAVAYELMINYNMLSEQIMYEDLDRKAVITNIYDVDTATVQGKKFVPVGSVFYEVLLNAPVSLFIQHKARIQRSYGIPNGYGTNQSTGKTTMTEADDYNLRNKNDYHIIPEDEFWIRKDNQMYKAENEKQVLKIFPEKTDAIKKYLKEKKLNLNKEADLKALIKYINGL